MADRIKLDYKESGDFKAYPEGTHPMRIVDVIDLGLAVVDYPGRAPEVKHKVAIVWAGTEKQENGDLISVSREFTNSLHKKAALRQALESMRGKSYTEEQAQKAARDENYLAKLVNHACLVTVEHKVSKKGRTYGVVSNLTALPKGMVAPEVTGYTRAPYWEERKAAYAEEVGKHRGQDEPEYPEDYDAEPREEDSDLPF